MSCSCQLNCMYASMGMTTRFVYIFMCFCNSTQLNLTGVGFY